MDHLPKDPTAHFSFEPQVISSSGSTCQLVILPSGSVFGKRRPARCFVSGSAPDRLFTVCTAGPIPDYKAGKDQRYAQINALQNLCHKIISSKNPPT